MSRRWPRDSKSSIVGLAHLESLLRPDAYAQGDRISIADVWLTPVRFTLDGLIGFAKRPDLLDRYPALAGYHGCHQARSCSVARVAGNDRRA